MIVTPEARLVVFHALWCIYGAALPAANEQLCGSSSHRPSETDLFPNADRTVKPA